MINQINEKKIEITIQKETLLKMKEILKQLKEENLKIKKEHKELREEGTQFYTNLLNQNVKLDFKKIDQFRYYKIDAKSELELDVINEKKKLLERQIVRIGELKNKNMKINNDLKSDIQFLHKEVNILKGKKKFTICIPKN
jgi:hypothetical protein